jgi:hypothetical protein
MFLDPKYFGGVVEYCQDVEARYDKAITLLEENGRVDVEINKPFDLVRLKRSEWAFQKEYRFSLFVLPSIPVPPHGPGSDAFVRAFPNHLATAIARGIPPGIEYLDLDLSEEALGQMGITLGPLCSEGAKLGVRALAAKYVPTASVKESQFAGDIRSRS